MNSDNNWLNEMIDAALTDIPESVKAPDFEAVRQSSSHTRYNTPFRYRRFFVAAAAALLAVGIAVPVSIITGRQTEPKVVANEQNMLFVEELIGEMLFDENLDTDGFWLFDDTGGEEATDI